MEITYSRILIFCANIALLALGGAYGAEFFLNLPPCHLCIYQRWIYGLIIAISLFGYCPVKFSKYLVWLVIFLFGAEFFVALYHIGVEYHWIALPEQCKAIQAFPQSFEAIKAQLLATPPVRCDKVAFRFLGLSMAEYNAIFAGI